VTSILKTLSALFSDSKSEINMPSAKPAEENNMPSTNQEPVSSTAEEPTAENFAEPPAQRRIIQAPVLVESLGEGQASEKVLIKAEPAENGDQCKLMVNRSLFAGYSWFFKDFESAAGSPLAEKIFSSDLVDTLLIHNSTAIVTKFGGKMQGDWLPLAKQLGQIIREVLESGSPLLSDDIIKNLPPEEQVRKDIQKVIDTEVNPGVAAHGGKIVLTSVTGNSVTIQMGGGCQGCSAADLTLKQGIHSSFRKAVPYVGAIYDETDHAAGMNPYYS